MRTILMAFIMALATQVGAEEISNDNYSTDNKLLSEVKTRMVLDNGLVVHIWAWNDKAKALGLDKYPPAGLIAQDVELMYPDAIVKDANGYLGKVRSNMLGTEFSIYDCKENPKKKGKEKEETRQ